MITFVGGDSAAFHAFNCNALDHRRSRTRRGVSAAELPAVRRRDRRSGVERLGLGYDFKRANPKIIYASGSGWGVCSCSPSRACRAGPLVRR